VCRAFLELKQEEVTMSEISKTTKDGAEHRKDGSKVATDSDANGETETDHVNRVVSERLSGGPSPDYYESAESDIVAPSPSTGANCPSPF
tara:strand:- start:174 stop:443 length:270 start_codon:yes stop_codon:yes gene_type:complete